MRRTTATALILGGFLVTACGGGTTDPNGGGGGNANALLLVSGNNQRDGTAATLSQPFVVRVEDTQGTAVSGVTVAWEITSFAGAGATLSASSTPSGADGTASMVLTLGSGAGAYTVRASISGSTVTFTATAEARVIDALVKVGGDDPAPQPVGTTLPDPFVVEALDQFGEPLEGTTVDFTLNRCLAGNPSIDAASGVTGSDGRVSVTLTLGDRTGVYGVVAEAGSQSVAFRAEATGGTEECIAVTSISPDPLVEGGTATITGTGFSSVAGENSVWFDGRPGTVTAATTGELTVTVPILCKPPHTAVVQVAFGADSAEAVNAPLESGETPLALAPGQDVVLAGPAEVSCVLLPPASAGEEYEVVATSLANTLGFSNMELTVNGRGPLSAQRVAPVAAADGAASFAALSGAQSVADLPPELRWRSKQYAFDLQLRELERQLLPRIRTNAALPTVTLQNIPAPGDQDTFDFNCISQSQFPNAPATITAEVVKVSGGAVIYEDLEAAGSFDPADYDAIANTFDNLIFDTDTTYFGAPGDVDANENRVLILYTAGVNRLNESYAQGFIAGFFCPTDLTTAGNNAEMFYVLVPDPNGDFTPDDPNDDLPQDLVRRVTDNTIAHEFQHLINAQTGGGGGADIWINEGLSHLAEEVVGHAANGYVPGMELGAQQLTGTQQQVNNFNKWYIANFGNLGLYLQAPADTSALLNASDPLGLNTFRMRGTAWLFLRYLLDRFDTGATEATRVRGLVASTAGDSRTAVAQVFGSAFNGLVEDWSGMLVIEDRDVGPDLGGAPRPELLLSSYQLRDIYEATNTGAVLPPVGNPIYPLVPLSADLAAESTIDADLFTATGQYVTLSTSGSGGTGLRLLQAGTGADLSPAIEPRLVIVRTK